jgi:hypothetical protein
MHIRTTLLAQKLKLMGLGQLRYINHFYSLYFSNAKYKAHKCIHMAIDFGGLI